MTPSAAIGLLVEIEDEQAPFAVFSHPRVEAVRFGASFVRRGTADLRMSCVLNSMVTLAQQLALPRLGPARSAYPFDYTPASGDHGSLRPIDASADFAGDFELSH